MKEKVLLVGVELPQQEDTFTESLEELRNLVESAGGEVVYVLTQKRSSLDRRTLIGKGKLAELSQMSDAYETELVIFNQELSPNQSQAIRTEIDLPVIDRVQLILDIFALRARSKAGKLQVELAQLNYLLPRLTGQGKSLSRLGGGIGTRGPGETKLETDRRHIRRRITIVKRDLKELEQHRERNRQKRRAKDVFQIGLIGYTNAGKSSLLNFLTEADAYEADQLFATLDPLTRSWELPQGMQTTITDTVGFIQDLPTQLIEAFQSTLEESREVDLLLHVVDASSPHRDSQEKTVIDLIAALNMSSIPRLTIYTKADKISNAQFTPSLYPNCLISVFEPSDRLEVADYIVKELKRILIPYTFTVKAAESGAVLEQLKRETLLLQEKFLEEKEEYYVSGYASRQSRWLKRMEKNA